MINIYLNLFEAIKKGILNRDFDENTKLPASRTMAKDLKISRSTVVKAYELLTLERYVKSIPGSGYFVRVGRNKKMFTST